MPAQSAAGSVKSPQSPIIISGTAREVTEKITALKQAVITSAGSSVSKKVPLKSYSSVASIAPSSLNGRIPATPET